MKNKKNCEGRYSLWLIPSGKTYYMLANLIFKLSRKFSTPNFQPHVTLIGKLTSRKELIKRTLQLASQISPYKIRFSRLDYFDDYFQNLVMRVEKTEEVMNANSKAKEIFGVEDERYMPHLSLLYGSLPRRTREEIVKNINEEHHLTDLEFEVTSLHLFSTEGKVREWYELGEFILGL
jgi:2'-5' RNA ligase